MADKYALYAKLNKKAQKLSDELKAVNDELNQAKQDILEEVKNLSKPLKCEYGTFSSYKVKKYTFSEDYYKSEQQFKEEIKKANEVFKAEQKREIEEGKAKVDEIIYLRVKLPEEK